jgi:hypothetical protein
MNKIYDYIIIGAGISGITYAFKNKTNNFIILEKNDYIGGRIKNIKWNDDFISLGGGVFLPSHNFVLDMCKKFEIPTQEYTSVYHLTDLQGTEPNNSLYYKDFNIIYKSLIQKYVKYKNEIKTLKLSFKEFLEIYFPYDVVKIILDNSLYSTNFNSDTGLFLNNEFLYDCLRIEDSKMLFIKKTDELHSGYDYIINKILDNINKENIKLNTHVNEIKKNGKIYEVITNNEVFTTTKIILATDILSNIKFNLSDDIKSLLNHIYDSIGYEPYIRIYSFHKNGHNLKNSCKTQGLISKTIIMNDKILMLCYNESNYAIELNNLLSKTSKTEQIEILYKLFENHEINIVKPDDIYIQFWNVGMHYCKPGFNIKSELETLKNEHNIEIVGEIISESHGWVNSALSTIK